MMRLLVAALALPASLTAQEPGAGWRKVATSDDRRRLRGWRGAWVVALASARAGGAGQAISAEGPLFDPDRGLGGATPPAGAYRCRTFKLGSQRAGGSAFVAYPWFRCRVEAGGRFAKPSGSQRVVGTIHPDTSARAVFLGTLVLGDQRRPLAYGRDRNRDMAGWVERVGERRWRIALPYPRFESLLDVIELVPESVGATGGGDTAGLGSTGGEGSGGSDAK